MQCECCGMDMAGAGLVVGLVECRCMEELLCARCNRCAEHCKCAEGPKWDVPYTEKLAVIRHEWRRMGVVV